MRRGASRDLTCRVGDRRQISPNVGPISAFRHFTRPLHVPRERGTAWADGSTAQSRAVDLTEPRRDLLRTIGLQALPTRQDRNVRRGTPNPVEATICRSVRRYQSVSSSLPIACHAGLHAGIRSIGRNAHRRNVRNSEKWSRSMRPLFSSAINSRENVTPILNRSHRAC